MVSQRYSGFLKLLEDDGFVTERFSGDDWGGWWRRVIFSRRPSPDHYWFDWLSTKQTDDGLRVTVGLSDSEVTVWFLSDSGFERSFLTAIKPTKKLAPEEMIAFVHDQVDEFRNFVKIQKANGASGDGGFMGGRESKDGMKLKVKQLEEELLKARQMESLAEQQGQQIQQGQQSKDALEG